MKTRMSIVTKILAVIIGVNGILILFNGILILMVYNYLMKKGYTVLRYWNHEVLEDIDAVLGDVLMKLKNM